jgi:hypothetical protein
MKLPTRQRQPRVLCEPYLAYIRTLPCLICGQPAEPAHIRTGSLADGKSYTGGGERSSDRWALPLCRRHHEEQHDAGKEIVFWNFYKLDPFGVAVRLWDAWKKSTGYEPRITPTKPRSSKERTPKPQGDTAWAASKPARKLRGKSAWPERHGTMKSRSNFGRQEWK